MAYDSFTLETSSNFFEGASGFVRSDQPQTHEIVCCCLDRQTTAGGVAALTKAGAKLSPKG